jgi:precorrin-2/cobalt-factor-2 C20-methyltransferase
MSKFYAIGVGPGDPELLTRKAERILREADVILAPVSKQGEPSVALDIVREFIEEGCQEVIIKQFPMTSDKEVLERAWQEAATVIAAKIDSGKDVAFITIGDPMLYSTFIYLLRIFRSTYPQIEIEIVPGISSINTSSAVAGIPLAEADEKVVIIPATSGIDTIRKALDDYDTVVLLKVKPIYHEIIALLREAGRGGCSLFVERVGSDRQVVLTDLDQMASHSPDYLSLMIVRRS